jgi:hypothetical protein
MELGKDNVLINPITYPMSNATIFCFIFDIIFHVDLVIFIFFQQQKRDTKPKELVGSNIRASPPMNNMSFWIIKLNVYV